MFIRHTFSLPSGFLHMQVFLLGTFLYFSPHIPPRYVYLLGTQLRSCLQRKLSLTTPRGLDSTLLGSIALSTILSQPLPPAYGHPSPGHSVTSLKAKTTHYSSDSSVPSNQQALKE